MYIWQRDADDRYYTRTTLIDDAPVYFFRESSQILNQGTIKDVFYPVTVWAKEDPKKIADYFVSNAMHIVSRRLKELLEAEDVSATVEFYPLEIVAGKRIQKPIPPNSYFLMNFLGRVDCFDLERSVYTRIDDWTVSAIEMLVLDESKIPSEAKLFYIFPFVSEIGLRDELAEKILDADFKGLELTKAEETKIL